MMKHLYIALILFISVNYSRADTYPKNPNIDIINYTFRIQLSDATDVIVGEATIDVRYLAAGVQSLRLDLVRASQELGNK
ncbi:MAG: hypothetical protein RLN96_04275, partial [Pseudomonadales bacterium]